MLQLKVCENRIFTLTCKNEIKVFRIENNHIIYEATQKINFKIRQLNFSPSKKLIFLFGKDKRLLRNMRRKYSLLILTF